MEAKYRQVTSHDLFLASLILKLTIKHFEVEEQAKLTIKMVVLNVIVID